MYSGLLIPDSLTNAFWMGWNTFLAVIPFLLAHHLFHPKQKLGALWGFLFILFVLFLPNAPYIFTDIIHLRTAVAEIESQKTLFIVSLQFFVFMLLGYFLFVESYRKFEKFVLNKKQYKYRYLLRLGTFTAISIGVYLGRFLRFNSWDIVASPFKLLASYRIANDWHFIVFTAAFTLLLFVAYYIRENFLSVRYDRDLHH